MWISSDPEVKISIPLLDELEGLDYDGLNISILARSWWFYGSDG
jgi:hypothetical protein